MYAVKARDGVKKTVETLGFNPLVPHGLKHRIMQANCTGMYIPILGCVANRSRAVELRMARIRDAEAEGG